MSDWQPIETAPKDGTFVLVCDESLDVPVTVGAYYKAERDEESGRFRRGWWDGWLSMDGDHLASISNPTHWMPLPSPPLPVAREALASDSGSRVSDGESKTELPTGRA